VVRLATTVARLDTWPAIVPALLARVVELASKSASTVAKPATSSVTVQMLHLLTTLEFLASAAAKRVTSLAIAQLEAMPAVVLAVDLAALELEVEVVSALEVEPSATNAATVDTLHATAPFVLPVTRVVAALVVVLEEVVVLVLAVQAMDLSASLAVVLAT